MATSGNFVMRLSASFSVLGILLFPITSVFATEEASLSHELKQEVLFTDSGQAKWFQPRPTPIPGYGKNGNPAVVMTIQKTKGSDYFTGLEFARTDDLGKTWSKPKAVPELGWRDGGDGYTVGICDFTLGWHAPTGKLLGTGHTARYTKKGFAGLGSGQRRDTVYSIYDPKTDQWTPWEILAFPKTADEKYTFNGTHGQWLVEPDGTILLPVYFISAKGASWKSSFIGSVVRCKFDGEKLNIIEIGNELKHSVPRGLYEKSITYFRGRYYMTMRNDQKGFVAVSDDGLHFGPIKAWTFDDGSDLGSYNTQQKWVTHSDGLFLVYTRRGANNDDVIRHRSPLFMAQVDPEKLHVIRDTEQVAVSKHGKAAFGNFGAATINENETWITVAGGGKTYCTRVIWSKPNRASNQVTR